MTRIGDKNFKPELFFRFVNVYIFNLITQDFLFVLQKDRAAENIWTPVGGEIDLPNTAEQTAIIEAKEEVGVEIEVIETISVTELYDNKSPYWLKYNAHTEIIELLALITKGQVVINPQPAEPKYEIIDLAWYSHEKFKENLQLGNIKTYPNIIINMDEIKLRIRENSKSFIG